MSRSLGGTSFTIRSPIFNSPEEISSRPAIIRRLVVFPHPEGPTRTMNSPSLMARFRSLTASTSPYFLVTWSNVTVAMCAPHSTGASRVPASSRHSASWTDPVRGAGSSWPMLTLPAVAPGVARGDPRADRLVPCQTSSGGTFGGVWAAVARAATVPELAVGQNVEGFGPTSPQPAETLPRVQRPDVWHETRSDVVFGRRRTSDHRDAGHRRLPTIRARRFAHGDGPGDPHHSRPVPSGMGSGDPGHRDGRQR